MQALSLGLQRHGIASVVADDHVGAEQADFLVWWGNKVPQYLQDKPYLLLEAGYINGQSGDYVRDRLRFVSAGWNGLHGRADPGHLDCPPNRWQALGVSLAPWRDSGDYVLICDQHPGDSVSPQSRNWWRELSDELGEERCIYRPHPLMAPDMRPLSEALEDAAACITWSSTCAVEAVISGVPTVALDRGSAAWDVCSHSFEDDPYLGPREQWAYNLAYRQWTHAELADGSAWDSLRSGLDAEQ
jgi:hypothetical protein